MIRTIRISEPPPSPCLLSTYTPTATALCCCALAAVIVWRNDGHEMAFRHSLLSDITGGDLGSETELNGPGTKSLPTPLTACPSHGCEG